MKKKKVTAAHIKEEIIRHKLRLTEPRKILAQVLENSPDHPNVAEIHERAHQVDKTISVATVYRTLNLLHKIGVLRRHEFNPEISGEDKNNKSHWRFEPSGHTDHYHLIDIKSGKIIEFESLALDKLQKQIAEKHGYQLHSYRIELYGLPQKTQQKP